VVFSGEFGALPAVRVNNGQLNQVFLNVLQNAIDAVGMRGTVAVRTEADDGWLTVSITDSGGGVPAEVRRKIFEPFFTTKEVGKGTGLGLAMVYGIVKQSGGYIQPESEVGKGTTFRIFLPRHIVEPAVAAEGEAADQAVAAGGAQIVELVQPQQPEDLTGSAVILLVEDEEAVRRGGKRMLETRGYTVHEAGSGVEALEIMEELEGKVDIVVSDVVMPEMDGPSLLRELRKKYPDMKFIFVSGYAEDAFARNLPPEAKFGFLPKPFSLKQLAVAVKETLDS
jgi:two-component system cell cycle sensor histidine kinase/response regulator CckA